MLPKAPHFGPIARYCLSTCRSWRQVILLHEWKIFKKCHRMGATSIECGGKWGKVELEEDGDRRA